MLFQWGDQAFKEVKSAKFRRQILALQNHARAVKYRLEVSINCKGDSNFQRIHTVWMKAIALPFAYVDIIITVMIDRNDGHHDQTLCETTPSTYLQVHTREI